MGNLAFDIRSCLAGTCSLVPRGASKALRRDTTLRARHVPALDGVQLSPPNQPNTPNPLASAGQD